MPKYSVRKPFTVVVAVIAIIVLGVVSFMGMTPNLLPNIDLPYILIITVYPGATPERVETVVSKPLEQTMATLDDIENVSSVSSENRSTMVLEFNDQVNMESITVDILQKISQIEQYWDDSVGTPIILKLNPNMLPVMVAAVNVEGMDVIELSGFVNDTLQNKLEGVAGIANVEAGGVIQETIEVTLDPVKIKTLNERIRREIIKGFDEAEDELQDVQDDLESKLDEIESAKDQLQSGIDAAADGAGTATGEIEKGKLEVMQMQMKIYDQLSALTTQLMLLEQTEKLLVEMQTAIQTSQQEINEIRDGILQLEQMQQTLAQLDQARADFDAAVQDIQNNLAMTEEERQAAIDQILQSPEYQQVMVQLAMLEAELAARGVTRETLSGRVAEMAQLIALLEAQMAEFDGVLEGMGTSRPDLDAALQELRGTMDQMRQGISMLENAAAQVGNGGMTIAEAQAELEKQKILGLVTLSQSTSQLVVGEATLTAALTEVESGLDQLDDAKKQALKAADLNNIVTLENLKNILMAQNFSMPAGYVEEDGISYLVRVGDSFSNLQQLQNLLLLDMDMDAISPIYLKDVATVEMINNAGDVYAKLDGNDGVLLSFTKQSTYATAAASDNLQQRFDELSEEYPGLSFVSLMDQGDYIYIVVNSILRSLLLGAVFAIIILFLFLKDLRPTVITLCSIPISVMFAIALMYFSGVTINIISLSGLAVSVGMLVDNSVVVIENIYRMRNLGYSPVQSAVSGATQVAGAITSSTLTTVCVFLPIVFVQGLTRELFTDMALTVAYSLMASLIVSLTLVPMMSSVMLRNVEEKPNHTVNRLIGVYEKGLAGVLSHKAILLAATVIMLVLSIVLALLRGFSFMPEMDMPEITVQMEMPEGATKEEAMAKADEVSARLREIPEVETVGAMMGGGGLISGFSGEGESAMFYVLLDEKAKRGGIEVAKEVNATFIDMDCEISASGSSSIDMSMLSGAGVSIELFSEDMDLLLETAKDVAVILEEVPGTQNVEDGIGDTDPEIRFVVDKNKAMQKGLTTAQVFAEISTALTSDTTATTLTSEGEDYDVVIVSGRDATPSYIRNYSFTVTDREGNDETIKITDIAQILETETARSITRENQRRYLTLSAEIEDGYNVSLVTQDAQRALRDYELPTGVSMEFTGENETIMEAFTQLFKMLGLGVLLVYLVMVAQFQSLKSPFIVMFTIPLAFTGGLLALLIAGMEVSVIALIGFVMLSGIIVNNGIVLVDYINQLREEGMDRRQAIIESGKSRMRPILMTSTTTILGLSVMAVGTGSGSELMQPVAVVCIGGLIYATLLTLFVIPALYDLFNRKELHVIADQELEIVDE